jgi:xanthine dehydrogenase accessory factor
LLPLDTGARGAGVSDWASVLADGGEAVLVTVDSVQGSGPRETGAWMLVAPQAVAGTIGGGRLEFDAIAAARELLAAGGAAGCGATRSVPAWASAAAAWCTCATSASRPADAPALERRLAVPLHPVALFGGGHVGRAIVRAAADLPFALTWIDSRDEIFPADVPPTCSASTPTRCRPRWRSSRRQRRAGHELQPCRGPGRGGCLPAAPARARRPALRRPDRQPDQVGDLPPPPGAARLHGRRTRPVRCPIGIPGITGKQPAVIAASAVAQLLQAFDAGT